jgi:hypothetical protein
MADTERRMSMPELKSGPLITGAVLVGAGTMLVLAGIAVGSAHVFGATRRWVNEMEVPPSQLARQQLARARAAAAAGSAAWQDGAQARAAVR